MADTTRQQFLQTARQLFARKGFYGTSLANIADELGLTKQALLHHFGSKEKLYAEILEGISERMLAAVAAARAAHRNPADQLEALVADLELQVLIDAGRGVARRMADEYHLSIAVGGDVVDGPEDMLAVVTVQAQGGLVQ